jgi:hypothetical protein
LNRLLKIGSAAVGIAAFAFLVWKADRPAANKNPVLAEKPSISAPMILPGEPRQSSIPKMSGVPEAQNLPDSMPGRIGPAAQVAPETPPIAEIGLQKNADETVDQSVRRNPPTQPVAGPAVVDLPNDWGRPIREISIPVPVGEMVPAVFQDDMPKPEAQRKALDRIAAEFERNVSEVPPGMTQNEVWSFAREIADERYITLFGYEAFNQFHLRGAREALREKKAGQTSKLPQTTP